MSHLAVKLLFLGAAWTFVAWCIFGAWSYFEPYIERRRFWRSLR